MPTPRTTASWPPDCVFARFPFQRTLADFDFQFQPSVDCKLIDDLATLRFIEKNRPVLFRGQPGCGKTHLAVALATAVEAGYRGYFSTADDMVNTSVKARRDCTVAANCGRSPPQACS